MEVRTSGRRSGAAEDIVPALRREPAQAPPEIQRIGRVAARALAVARVCIYLPAHDGLSEAWAGPGSDELVEFCRSVTAGGRSIAPGTVASKYSSLPRGEHAPSGSYVSIPIAVSEDVHGLFCASDPDVRCFTRDQVELAQEFAALASGQVQQQKELRLLSGHLRDVTDSDAVDAEISRSRKRAEEVLRLKSIFLSDVSHEIRTPLTTILGFAEILADEVDEGSREFVHLIQEGGERLLDTLMSILDLARIQSSDLEVPEGQFDVAEKVEEICRLMAPLAEEKGLYLHFEREEPGADSAMDVFALERVLTSLISNGIKFTEKGGVTVSLEADDDHVLIHVADTGIGIDPGCMPYLFGDGKRDSAGFARVYEGSGLGLSIAKRLVELMKGNIMAESEKGRGTVFTVALPRGGEVEGVQASGNGSGEEAARTRVLVVEDNADTRTLVNHLLRKNYDVRCATDADDALRLAAERRYDVLLVDINLGKGMSGEDVLSAVKSLPEYESTPVIAVTAYAMPGDRERFFAAGFDEYVSKPFSKQQLLEAVEGVLA